MMETGQICVKTAGRDAGKKCIIIDLLEKNYALIDGETRRRKCNIAHLEPLNQKIDIKKGASHEEIKNVLKKIGVTTRETKPKKKATRPRKLRRSKLARTKTEQTTKKTKKKAKKVKKESSKENKVQESKK